MATTATPPTSHSGVLSRTPTSPVCWRCPPSTTLLTTLTVPVMYMHLSRTCLHQFHWISCLSHRSLTYISLLRNVIEKILNIKNKLSISTEYFSPFSQEKLIVFYTVMKWPYHYLTICILNHFFFQYLIYMCKHSFYLLESFQIHC